MKKIIFCTLVLSLSISTQFVAMDRVPSNQKPRNENLLREAESPNTQRPNVQNRKDKAKQQRLTRSQERQKKYDTFNR